MSSSTFPQTSNEIGDFIEAEVIDRLPLEAVDDTEAIWYDARVSHHISMGTVDLSDVLTLERGTPVEIKGARYRVQPRPRRGRFYIKQGAHERLIDVEGVYCFVVYDEQLLATAWRRAEAIDELLGSWIEVNRSHSPYAQLAWSRVIPPKIVNGGGRA